MEVYTEEGVPAKMVYQIADVTRPLCSIAKVCDKGNRVVFDSQGGFVEDCWGHKSHFARKGNIYTMSFFAMDPGNSAGEQQPSGFTRPSM